MLSQGPTLTSAQAQALLGMVPAGQALQCLHAVTVAYVGVMQALPSGCPNLQAYYSQQLLAHIAIAYPAFDLENALTQL